MSLTSTQEQTADIIAMQITRCNPFSPNPVPMKEGIDMLKRFVESALEEQKKEQDKILGRLKIELVMLRMVDDDDSEVRDQGMNEYQLAITRVESLLETIIQSHK